MNKCIITAASNTYFPNLLNLIGSIKHNYPDHPTIYIYDLGLSPIFKEQIQNIPNTKLIKMPNFCNFWNNCYTWKTYIFTKPLAELNFYIDAGAEVLGSLEEIFIQIKNYDYFAVDQEIELEKITPLEYKCIFELKDSLYKESCLAAGIFGFKKSCKFFTFAVGRVYLVIKLIGFVVLSKFISMPNGNEVPNISKGIKAKPSNKNL